MKSKIEILIKITGLKTCNFNCRIIANVHFFKVTPTGELVAHRRHTAISQETLQLFVTQQQAGATFEAAARQVRQSQVPAGYLPSPWNPLKADNLVDILRSITATCIYR